MVESLEWLTDIIEAHDGTEQRVQVRQEPRQSFEVSVMLEDQHELSKLRVALAAWQDREWGWPCWHEAVKIGASLASGSGSISVDTTLADFRPGGLAIIHQSPALYEVVEIDTVASDSLTLVDDTTLTHPAGSSVMPLRMARMGAQARREDWPGQLFKYSVTMHVTDNVALTTEASATQYLGHDVLTDPLLMPGQTMPRSFDRAIEALDPGPGAWVASARTGYPLIATDHRWRVNNRTEAWAFRRWLHRRAGMLTPVWVPSWRDDLVLAVQPSSSATVLQVHDTQWRTLGVNQPTMNHVAVFRESGGFVIRQINSAVAGSAGRENITISASLGFTDVKRISFIALNRFAGDRISLTWDRVGVAEIRASMVGVAI